MLLRVTHDTNLTYTDLISETAMELRMAPRQEQHQHRLAFNLALGPSTAVTSYFDWLGNIVHAFSIKPFHQQIRIIATSVVETARQSVNPLDMPDIWPIASLSDYALYDYLQFGGPVTDCEALRRFAAELAPRQGVSLGRVAMRMLDAISERFEYQKGVTTAASPITDILEHRRGVCQDFTHLMIGLCRALGIPARYVSGLLHSERQAYRGASQTHAWCEVYFPSAGWIGLDPTNSGVVNSSFVTVAVGRDYRDVPPHKGLFKGVGPERMEVHVTTEVLPSVPAGLHGERFQSLPVPVFDIGRHVPRDPASQQKVQQQQQQRLEGEQHHQQQQQQQSLLCVAAYHSVNNYDLLPRNHHAPGTRHGFGLPDQRRPRPGHHLPEVPHL